MTGPVVVDASVVVKWLVPETLSLKAHALGLSWVRAGTRPVAPFLMPVEVANALHRRVLRREISLNTVLRLLEMLRSGIELREAPGIHQRAVELAALLRQDTPYDTHYLALAEALKCELWTADERFVRAASSQFPTVRSLGGFSATA